MKMKEGVTCNDRLFEKWAIKMPIPGTTNHNYVGVQVYAVPQNGSRGANTSHFKAVYRGQVVIHENLSKLREMLENLVRDVEESDYEKVLVIRVEGDDLTNRYDSKGGDEFGLCWQIGWRIAKLNAVYDEEKRYIIKIDNDEPEDTQIDGFRIGSKGSENKISVIPWTQEREDAIKAVVTNIGKMRSAANSIIMQGSLAKMLDDGGRLLLKS
jgi:hypothetical protein